MKKIAIIGTVGIPSKYGGFETLAHHLTKELQHEYKLSVYCSKKAYSKNERLKTFNGARLFYLPFDANGIQSIVYDIVSIIHALFYADVLIILGVSGGILVPFVRLFTKKKIIINIDGLEWRRNKWNVLAKRFLKFSERIAVKFSHVDITDNEAIKRYTSINYKTLSHLIEYGGDHVVKEGDITSFLCKYDFLEKSYDFKVARIEPENNIHLVLEAYARTNHLLVIVGNWANSKYGRDLKEEYSTVQNIILLNPIYEQEELDVIRRNCRLYVHGHSAGGTNPSLVEAMNLGLVVLSFDVSYNRATTENQAIYFKNVDDIVSKLNEIDAETLATVSSAMYKIASVRYTWKAIAAKYKNLIHGFDFEYKKQNINSEISELNKRILQKNGLSHLANPLYYYQNDEIITTSN